MTNTSKCVYKHRQVCSYGFAHTQTQRHLVMAWLSVAHFCAPTWLLTGGRNMEGANSDMLLAVGDHMFWPPVSSHVRAQKKAELSQAITRWPCICVWANL